jgi:hypothetical protein
LAWEGFTSNEAWFRANFKVAAEADALAQANNTWGFALRKEGNSFRAVIYE